MVNINDQPCQNKIQQDKYLCINYSIKSWNNFNNYLYWDHYKFYKQDHIKYKHHSVNKNYQYMQLNNIHFIIQNFVDNMCIDQLNFLCMLNKLNNRVNINEKQSLRNNQLHKKLDITYPPSNMCLSRKCTNHMNCKLNIMKNNFYMNLMLNLNKILCCIDQHKQNFINNNYQHIKYIEWIKLLYILDKLNYKIYKNYQTNLNIKMLNMLMYTDHLIKLNYLDMKYIEYKNCHCKLDNIHCMDNNLFHLNNIFFNNNFINY